MSPIILLAGGTGLVGSRLQDLLREKGYAVRLLTRKPKADNEFAWDPVAGAIDDTALRGVQAVVNLAGAGIAERRWTAARKQLVLESRVRSAAVLREAIGRTGERPAAYISASAIGYYGNSGEQWMREDDRPATGGFLSDTCRQWEAAADSVAALGIRTVKVRIGIVLAREGGALCEIAKPVYFGAGVYFADGQAWYSWIHRDDLCRAIIHFIENETLAGVFNAVAPQPARNKALTRAVVKAIGRPALLLPAPAFALRLVLGEMADTVLFSNRVSADKLSASGFNFVFPELIGALNAIFRP